VRIDVVVSGIVDTVQEIVDYATISIDPTFLRLDVVCVSAVRVLCIKVGALAIEGEFPGGAPRGYPFYEL
jgi:hypothetical protein